MASTDGPSQHRAAAPPESEITGSSSSSNVINVPLIESDPYPKSIQKVKDDLFVNVMDGNWDAVVKLYTHNKLISQSSMITKSEDTALHIAIMDNKTEAAKKLLDLVDDKMIKEMKNERGNNPLHLAAARGQVEICKRMMKKDETLIGDRNKDGETPLFLAALHGKKGAFYSLHPKCPISGLHIVHDISHCRRNLDGNSILHVAILGEYFELAYQIMHWYPELSEKNSRNEKGYSPLEFLAKNPSAFRSGCHLRPLDEFIYNCSTIDKLKLESPSDIMESSPKSNDCIPGNYRACFDLFEILRKATKIFFAYTNPFNACREEEDIENLSSCTQSKFSKPNQLEVHMEKKDEDVEIQSSPVHSKCIPKRSKGKDMQQHEPEKETTQDDTLLCVLCEHIHLKIVDENTVEKDGSKMEGRPGREDFSASQLAYPPNYSTFFRFLEFLMELFLFVFGLGFFKVHKIKETKRKHAWTVQIMQKLVSQLSQAYSWEYEEAGSQPSHLKDFRTGISLGPEPMTDGDHKTGVTATNQDEITGGASPTPMDDRIGVNTTDQEQTIHAGAAAGQAVNAKGYKEKEASGIIKEMEEKLGRLKMILSEPQEGKQEKSPILVAAKMGVAEMVEEILQRFPVAIEDVNQDKKNVVLLAVENRQPRVYTFLQNKYATNETIFQKVDKEGNSALHLAATLGNYRPWMIPGAALQMQWELKWFEFIKVSMPRHFFARLNNSGHTAKEVFAETHKELVKDGGTWLTNTSQSCSVIAALIATVAFASAATVPGGVKQDRGTPTLEGKPAFDVFAISSLVALCFSVTSLTMFLSILTSRYQVEDFHYSLPTKLILGLTSLFVSIAAMLVAFCAGHFFVLADRLKYAAFPVYAITCLPVTLFAVAQFPLYFDLLKSTMAPVPKRSYEVTSL